MPEPVGNSSRYDPSQLKCTADVDQPLEPQPIDAVCAPPAEPQHADPLQCSADAGVASLVAQFARPQPVPTKPVETTAGAVLSLGVAASAETTITSAMTPASGLPGGVAIAAGVYVDFERLEVGTYRRLEMRWAAGAYAGAGFEAAITGGRENFDGVGAVAFAEGGSLGKVGLQANPTSAGVSLGVGTGAAAGIALSQTTTEPALRADQFDDWGPSPFRRGP